MKAFYRILPLAILGVSISAVAQQAPCGLTSMTETVQPVFPPIAKAARIGGVVVMLAEFDTKGAVKHVEVVSGPEMLRYSAISSVKTWKANPYSGPRTCPVAIIFHLNWNEKTLPPLVRPDLQHIVVNSDIPEFDLTPNYSIATSTR